MYKRKTNAITDVYNGVILDRNISLKARGLLIFMLNLPDDWEYSEKRLSIVTGEGLNSLISGLKELENRGYLVRERQKTKDGRFSSVTYTIYENPIKRGDE